MIERFQYIMQSLQRLMKAQEMTANNLANLNTPGFKADALFYETLIENINGKQHTRISPHQSIQFTQGNFENTGNTFDLAIEGEGFFKIEVDGEEVYTRNGRFRLNEEGTLVTESGNPLIGSNGPVFIPTLDISSGLAENNLRIEVAKNGRILVNDLELDTIEIYRADNISAIQKHASGNFTPGPETEMEVAEDPQILQGFYEQSNVSPLQELTSMLSTSGMFEAQQRAMTTTDELISRATNSLSRF